MSDQPKYAGTATVSYDGLGDSYNLDFRTWSDDFREGDEYEIYIKKKPKPPVDTSKPRDCSNCCRFWYDWNKHGCTAGEESVPMMGNRMFTNPYCKYFIKGQPQNNEW